MSSWLLSVVGVVVIGVLVELLLTDSSVSKFIKSIYAFFILFVIVQPLPSFFKNAAETVSAGGDALLNTELLKTINSQTAVAFQRNTENALKTAGFENVLVTIDVDKAAQTFKINNIYVNAFNVVLDSANFGIDMKEAITSIVCSVCNVNREVVFLYVKS